MNEKISLGEALNIIGQVKKHYRAVEKIDEVLALAEGLPARVKEMELRVVELKRQEEEAYKSRLKWEGEAMAWETRAAKAKLEAEKYAPILAQYEAFKVKLGMALGESPGGQG
jgi:hypothetical protein